MNFLAHAVLSFNHPKILVGNLLSDFVKGKKQYEYSAGVQAGIRLHRQIDSFTDSHAATKEAKTIFQNPYRLYSGAIVDIVYDHFLALYDLEFTEASLTKFSTTAYEVLEENAEPHETFFQSILPNMKKYNWLYNYRFKEGIYRSLTGLANRAKYIDEVATAQKLFEENYAALQKLFEIFWSDVKPYAHRQFLLQKEIFNL